MGRQIPTGIYRNCRFAEKGEEYERHYRLATMEHFRWMKPRQRPYRQRTEWFWQKYQKELPGRFKRRMARDHDENWHLPYEQMRLKRRASALCRGEP